MPGRFYQICQAVLAVVSINGLNTYKYGCFFSTLSQSLSVDLIHLNLKADHNLTKWGITHASFNYRYAVISPTFSPFQPGDLIDFKPICCWWLIWSLSSVAEKLKNG